MTTEEEEGPVGATPTASSPRVTASQLPRGDCGTHGVTSSSGRRLHQRPHTEEEDIEDDGPDERIPEEDGRIQEVEGRIQEVDSRIQEVDGRIQEVEDVGGCEADSSSSEDDSSDASVLVVPYPELVPVVFFCMKQTTCPRSLCIRMVCNPYPFTALGEGPPG
ncbi:unnamed protein product [Knipowitschia caucasica]|uniref:t-SNARE coiled-coil homology domain-containing protein n=1 Tax=Knipowitschia caucasica TaxID=637954 RepID=A0AAV2LJM7_KNICA